MYALGVVLYEMLCGRPPFDADTDVATALARLHSDPPRPRQIKADLRLRGRHVLAVLDRSRLRVGESLRPEACVQEPYWAVDQTYSS